MSDSITAFFDHLNGKTIAFLGIGITNTPLAEMFIRKGCRVIACDKRPIEALGENALHLQELGAELKLGDDYLSNIEADVIFRTPGMSYTTPELEEYRRQGVIVTSELEVFMELCPARVIAVTGSSGKTTVCSIIADMLERSGNKVWLGGNIGMPLLPDIEKISSSDWVVCELSSFQLISMRPSPDIAVITNISPNHLDKHRDMGEYINAKRNIYLHQSAFGRVVFNADCPISSGFIGEEHGSLLTFSRKSMPFWGAYADQTGDIWFSDRGCVRRIMNRSELRIAGTHNLENYLTAICAVDGLVSDEVIRETAHLFCGVEHRAEFVRCVNGVSWYNDSIATTPSRCICGTLSLFDKKIILIAGGYDKKLPFDEFGDAVCLSVKLLILIGATADQIEAAVLGSQNYADNGVEILHAADMAEAVSLAALRAQDGDIVSLSPACAAFDMYQNFSERGRHYKELVSELKTFSVHSRIHDYDDDDEGFSFRQE